MKLNEIRDNEGAHHRKMRVGRGIGSSKGKTCGRGGKGQTAHTRVEFDTVNTGDIEKAVAAGTLSAKDTIDLAALKKAGLVRNASVNVKLLAKGEIKAKVKLAVDAASASAKAAVEKVGGEVTVMEKESSAA